MTSPTSSSSDSNKMSSLALLAKSLRARWTPWTCSWYPSRPATDESIARIQTALNFVLPPDFIELSRLADNYGVHFGSIGDDYDSHNHILRLNCVFHDPVILEEGVKQLLPPSSVLINHGHDGDCDCLNLMERLPDGEYPIYYVNVCGTQKPDLRSLSFRQYLNNLG